ncbi:MAG: Hsp20/alpha crystallin family protein [Anaerolineales bacterium]|nr:Hsp20/alpha crystallin family protein [Anaerolineales bacterium]
MADTTKSLQEVEKQELTPQEDTERTRDCQCFVPRADIYETEDQIVVVADVPGAAEDSIEITLEKNILTINAYVDPTEPEGYSRTWAEYEVGDYQRSFRVSDGIDREKIQATIKDGVLRLYLPKSKEARTRKISVKAG